MFLTGFQVRRVSRGVLKRSLFTNPREISPPKTRWPSDFSFNVVFTLDPNKFAEKKQRRLYIGDAKTFRPLISLLKHLSPVASQAMDYDVNNENDVPNRLSFPPDTKAFLYYSMSPEKPRIAGELRLRVATSDDPASFESGSDLLLANGRTWSRPLYKLSKHFLPLYDKLREDRLVPDDLDTALSTLPSKNPKSYRQIQILYTLNDPFIVNFNGHSSVFLIITEQGVEKPVFYYPFFDSRTNGRPYTGSALARFERSTLPDHKGTRTVVLRFLKIITPVKCVAPLYEGFISCPMEGELYRRNPPYSRITHDHKPVWSINIDKSDSPASKMYHMLRGLQLLWDV